MPSSLDDTTKKATPVKTSDNLEVSRLLLALGWMYEQYCGSNYGHDFMGAGEDAIEILEDYGLGNEEDGVDIGKLDRLEHKLNRSRDYHCPFCPYPHDPAFVCEGKK